MSSYVRRRKTNRFALIAGGTAGVLIVGVAAASAATYDTAKTNRVAVHNGGAQLANTSGKNGKNVVSVAQLSVSTSGRYVGFVTNDPHVVQGDTNGPNGGGTGADLFVNDRVAKTVKLVSIDDKGSQVGGSTASCSTEGSIGNGMISANGTTATFDAVNSVCDNIGSSVYVRNLTTHTTKAIVDGSDYFDYWSVLGISATGRYVAVADYFDGHDSEAGPTADLVLFDTTKGTSSTIGLPVADTDAQEFRSVSVSTDGRYITYQLVASKSGVYRFDRNTNKTATVALGGALPSATPDGRYVAFDKSSATNNTLDVFRKDMTNGAVLLVSVGTGTSKANGASYPQSISANGDFIAFTSAATNLVAGDTNKHVDVFVREIAAKLTRRVDLTSAGVQANDSASNPVISADGKHTLFLSKATNLVGGDTNGIIDAFSRDAVNPS